LFIQGAFLWYNGDFYVFFIPIFFFAAIRPHEIGIDPISIKIQAYWALFALPFIPPLMMNQVSFYLIDCFFNFAELITPLS